MIVNYNQKIILAALLLLNYSEKKNMQYQLRGFRVLSGHRNK